VPAYLLQLQQQLRLQLLRLPMLQLQSFFVSHAC
jgi:hypothetical protein